MSLKERIESDLKSAMKTKDVLRLSVIRMVKTAIGNKEIELKAASLDDAQVIQILTVMAKRTQESIEQFEKGGRNDLSDKEKSELAIIRQYLPPAISEEELSRIIDDAIKEAGAAGPKDMGKVMKVLMPKTAGRADGKLVSTLVQEKLNHVSTNRS